MADNDLSQITLQGWDAAFAVSYSVLNGAIAAQKTSPKSFHLEEPNDDDGIDVIDGTWGDWKVTPGGDGKEIHLECPIVTGTGTLDGGTPRDLSGRSLFIQVRLTAVEDASQNFQDPTSQAPTGPATALRINTTGSNEDPAVTVNSITDRQNPLRRFRDIFESWFNAHLADFGHTFGAAMLNLTALSPGMQWLKPTHIGYACVETEASSGRPANGVFATLLILNRPVPPNLASQIDPHVLQGVTDDANSVFVISGEQFVQNVLIHGAKATFRALDDDFTIQGNGLEVTNVKELPWVNMQLDSGKTVTPMIPANGFMMRIVQDKIELNFNGMWYNNPDYHMVGNQKITINYTQQIHPYFAKKSDGSFALACSDGDPNGEDKYTSDVTHYSYMAEFDEQAKQFEEGMAWAGVALSILPGVAALGKAGAAGLKGGAQLVGRLSSAARAGEAAEIGATELRTGLQAARSAAGAVRGTEEFTSRVSAVSRFVSRIDGALQSKFAMNFNRVATISGIGAALAGAAYGAIELDKKYAQDDVADGLDSINHFMSNCLGPTKFPGTGEWIPLGMRMAQSWVIYGKLDVAASQK